MKINPSRLATAIKRRGVNQRFVAYYCNVTDSTVSRWLSGEKPIPSKYESVIAKIVKRPLTWLKGGQV